jgi:hypothetical protein
VLLHVAEPLVIHKRGDAATRDKAECDILGTVVGTGVGTGGGVSTSWKNTRMNCLVGNGSGLFWPVPRSRIPSC